jgi:3-deoxy-D-manno-octulosonic-acid transferase
VWLHAVSLGETRAAAALVDALRDRDPSVRLLLTHGTATGREAGRTLLRDGDLQCWLPFDTPGATRRFFARHRPAVGVLMETEVWPALLHAAAGATVPVVLANARLSERSATVGGRWRALLRPAVRTLSLVLAQTADDAARLRVAGARRIEVAGNLKYDVHPSPQQQQQGAAWRAAIGRPVVLAASTRDGEEAPLLAAWAASPTPRPLLLLVPRHPQRFGAVAAAIDAAGLVRRRRSEWEGHAPAGAGPADVWLGDSIGEMALYYGAADVALLGGSFEPFGGQNLIEAAACGCPVVMGPHTFNFSDAAARARAAGAALEVPDLPAGVTAAVALAMDPARPQWVARARAFAAAHRGAAARMAAAIDALREGRRTD